MGRKPKDFTLVHRPGGKAIRSTGEKAPGGGLVWVLRCDCGTEHTSAAMHNRKSYACRDCVYSGGTFQKHGKSKTPEYARWKDMKSRCYNPKVRSFKDYGGRGISVCEDWRNNFEEYQNYIERELGPPPSDEHTIDRVDNDGDYEPGNLRWASKHEQTHNRRI